MDHDVLIIGGGLSGLTAASLLARRGLSVAVIEKSAHPGGSCGAFRRGSVFFDQGAAMLYGFGEKGFNAHRFVVNCLEEPIDVIRHDLLYAVTFKGRRIPFWADVDRFAAELAEVFPTEKDNIRRFYADMLEMYHHVLVERPSYTSADQTDPKTALKSLLRHPLSYARFLGYLNKSARDLLEKYFSDPEIFQFFDKLTSTYCYATVAESPAVLAAVMFVDNHVGGSFYPAGSTLFLPGKLEKVIEENGGDMLTGREAVSILFEQNRPCGVLLDDNTVLRAPNLVYSGTVWNLYGMLIDPVRTTAARREWARSQAATYPSVVLYAVVDYAVIPADTAPIEMLVGNPDALDESEVTAYILSLDDRTLCGPDEHTVVAIGPSFARWAERGTPEYQQQKFAEQQRLIAVLEKRFPGFSQAVRSAELASPRTIERYTMKNGGAVAGPKQMLGQHILHRLHIRTEWDNLYCCGESTVMGTGTPTVTTSGLSAANALLKKLDREPYVYRPDMPDFVRTVAKPFQEENLYAGYPERERAVMLQARRCRFCERPTCTKGEATDIPGVMRRITVGNFHGARKRFKQAPAGPEDLARFEARCVCGIQGGTPVAIQAILSALDALDA